MTEAEWLTGGDLVAMLEFVRPRTTNRKQRLFACACCRLIVRGGRPGEAAERAAQLGERCADEGGLDEKANFPACQELILERSETDDPVDLVLAGLATSCLLEDPLSLFAVEERVSLRERLAELPARVGGWLGGPGPTRHRARERMNEWCPVAREVFGNPFRPVTFDPAWRTPTATALASQTYESRDFSAMPILADALQDAGCDSDDVLSHCRGPGSHVRGCWVVDLVLGKE